MPRLVPDSDDEDGEDLELQSATENERWVPSGKTDDEASTRSTDRLQRQIHNTELSLFAASTSNPPRQQHPVIDPASTTMPGRFIAGVSSDSPSDLCLKRRHTNGAGDAIFSPPNQSTSIKRTKTMKTYSSSKRASIRDDEANFAALRDDTGPSSPVLGFSEHSRMNSSNVLPTGSAQMEFMLHEPALMFRDSGSTVVDGEESQQLLLEQALMHQQRATEAAMMTSVSNETQEEKSSPFPWTASQATQSTKLAKTQDDSARLTTVAAAENALRDGLTGEQGEAAVESVPPVFENTDPNPKSTPHQPRYATVPENESTKFTTKPSSPIVQIPINQAIDLTAEDPSPPKKGLKSAQKRALQHDPITTLSSDEAAIGLPKEQYKPRPSKRRATATIEEPIDFSAVPGKPKRTKRTKTSPAVVNVPESGHAVASAMDTSSSKSSEQPKIKEDDESVNTTESRDVETKSPAVDLKPEKSTANDEKDIFDLPDEKPKPKPKSRMKRGKTTIFEDHVKLEGSQRSLNLSQQQEERKSALRDLQNDSKPPNTKKRNRIIDDDDEEDELAAEDDNHGIKASSKSIESPSAPQEPPPKPSCGRPAKKTAKSKSTITKEDDSEVEAAEHESESDQAPRKKTGGRPKKKQSKSSPPPAEPEGEPKEQTSKPATQEPTPSPEKTTPVPEAPLAPPSTTLPGKQTTNSKPSPSVKGTHSPIKKSAVVPVRVGLSKSQRIPSLLRMMKPPKR